MIYWYPVRSEDHYDDILIPDKDGGCLWWCLIPDKAEGWLY